MDENISLVVIADILQDFWVWFNDIIKGKEKEPMKTKHNIPTRSTSIRKYCRECSGDSISEVKRCELTDCPLWPYRTRQVTLPPLPKADSVEILPNKTQHFYEEDTKNDQRPIRKAS